jgi:hypothetical protein
MLLHCIELWKHAVALHCIDNSEVKKTANGERRNAWFVTRRARVARLLYRLARLDSQFPRQKWPWKAIYLARKQSSLYFLGFSRDSPRCALYKKASHMNDSEGSERCSE